MSKLLVPVVARLCANLILSLLTALSIAADHVDLAAKLGERYGGGFAESAVGAGDEE